MKLKTKQLIVGVVSIVCLMMTCTLQTNTAHANTLEKESVSVTIDLQNISPDLAAQVLKAKKKADEAAANAAAVIPQATTIIQEVKEATEAFDPAAITAWAEAVGSVVTEMAGALNVTVNEFLNTPAGLGIAGIIIWKAGGPYLVETILDLAVGSAAWCIFSIIFIWVFHRLFFARNKITHKAQDGTMETSYEPRTSWKDKHGSYDSGDKLGTMIVIAVMYLIISIGCLGTIIW